MTRFNEKSLIKLYTCDSRIVEIFLEVVKDFDCTILEGYRDRDRQDQLNLEGKSQVTWPNSKHNYYPSKAVDVIPYPIVWDDRERMCLFAGHVLAFAKFKGVNLRWGGDWDRDTETRDNNFDDLVHFELFELSE